MGIGSKVAQNLLNSMKSSRKASIEDARFLAAFGIPHLGLGDSRKLLKEYTLQQLEGLSKDKIEAISGFGTITSVAIANGLSAKMSLIKHMMSLYTNIEVTKSKKIKKDSPISGKKIMFTGKMESNRDEMKENAKSLGAKIGSSVTKSLDFLVIGSKASAAKNAKAKKLGVRILTEKEYHKLLED